MKAESLRSSDLSAESTQLHSTWTRRPHDHIARDIPVGVESTSEVFALEPRSRSERANRILNFCLASLALIVLSPVLVLVTLSVKLSSPGPILYTQTRIGLDRRRPRRKCGGRIIADRRTRDLGGHVFRIYKFRSMRTDAETGTGAVWATKGDARVTSVGRVLRKCRLDELPQLINVLRGDMNIVGPRPERPSIFARLREDIVEYSVRQRAKPGITGWAQVNATYDVTVEDVRRKVRFDIEYLRRQSVIEDLRIMMRTIPVVLFHRSGW